MKALALHGFLGQGSDWLPLQSQDPLQKYEWHCPDLFDREQNLQFSSFQSLVNSFTNSLSFKNVDLLIGYSFGGRLAVEIIKHNPDFAKKIVLVSAHLGGMTDKQSLEKKQKDSAWALRFLTDDWQSLISDWNRQSIFSDGNMTERLEQDYDRRKLYLCLENLSVSEQALFLDLPEVLRKKFHFIVGEKDTKFASLYDSYKKASWISGYSRLPAGHRVHLEAPKALAEQLQGLVVKPKID